ncbi:restriction endonuclease subunit S [Vibrio parahaemolyticus]|uniref:restriction endonuclease subunit S n=1 Tax=Vibrio parahaemolyticus TaxID=670 RepID=UPI001A2C4E7D|nr:restriction endonuclease subunit S [Vibrio parahaemolyticus]EGQ8307696.1 restriction endonuclease subunit S [Vibrio parahaemolyticus]EGR2937234.1 restriction endonuclease subunit S [Vibrio parahaemolyticus]EGR3274933.1 restriction endonuclease subunit S [Vibrio parahaemolyticus]EGR3310037.1 restriction endonuclease subunit S [Vibrio parahaemolyticus]EJG0166537.1 restriction endonuclease subunit S [Vibrio parahaemolyticus]
MAVENLITEHIDIWTSAVKTKSTSGRGSSKKLELYGVKKLRDLILELAVRGKLVPQDSNDEPASVLLERIARDKAQLIKDKKIKKNRKQPEITQDEIYFSVPENWSYARLEDIYDVRDGTHDSPKPTSKGYPLVTSKNLSSGKLDLSTATLISKEDHLKVIERSRVDRGDILFAMIGSIGNPVIVDTDIEFSIKNVGLFKYYNPKDSSPNFLNYFLKYAAEIMKKQSTGGVQPFVSLGKLRGFVMPIPPISEQHRIVAKVDELMALCDQLEQQTEASIEAHQVLVTTLLDTLTNSANADELMQNWARISEHFDTLFTTEESIDQLKQTILQLAVMGKLVPQDPSDEPAAELLKRIAEEKAQLVKEKKIKKQKALPPIAEDEKPFELPNGWEWCRLGNLFSFLNGFAFKSEWFNDKGIRLLRNINIAHSETKWADVVCVSAQLAKEYEKYSLNAGDIVISLDRPIINTGLKYAVVDESDLPCLLLQRVAKFHSYAGTVSSSYLSKWLESDLFMSSIDPGRSNGVPHISTKQLEMLPFPLAPLSHQTRISDKVDEIIYLCQQLEIRVKESQITKAHLTDAIIEQTT